MLGLSVSYDLEESIPKDMAWARTWRAVFWHNEEFPVRHADYYYMKLMYEAAERGEPLLWEYESHTTLCLKDKETWRSVVCFIGMVLIIVLIIYISVNSGADMLAKMPVSQGRIYINP